MSDKPIIEWQNCYQEKWGSLLNPESVSHPAKMARGLVFRIYEYAIEKGYIQSGNTVLDPFAGIGGTALPALMHGMNWLGNELEPLFADCARGCECTGISKDEYVRFYGRWRRVAYKGRHFCPQCIMQSERSVKPTELPLSSASKNRRARIAELETSLRDKGTPRRANLISPIPFPEKFNHVAKQADMFGLILEASYKRNSYTIPYTTPHHYTGNLENWQKYAKGGAVAVCTMGDSRILSTIIRQHTNTDGKSLGEARNAHLVKSGDYGTTTNQLGNLPPGDLDSIVSSPPYVDSMNSTDTEFIDKHHKDIGRNPQGGGAKSLVGSYGTSDGQLGSLKEGSLDSLLSSPPYANSLDSEKSGIDPSKFKDPYGKTTQALRPTQYGKEDGQLGSLPEGSLDSLISSSPFADSIGSDDPDKRGGLFTKDAKRRNDKNLTGSYGASDGQLGTMKDEGFDMSVGSPPFASNLAGGDSDKGILGQQISDNNQTSGGRFSKSLFGDYGKESGQLANLPDKGFDASISSPSFAGNTGGRGDASRNGIDPALFDRSSGGMKRGTGESEDNLDHLPMKGFDSAISSPPFENVEVVQDKTFRINDGRKAPPQGQAGYGNSDGQLGQDKGVTFWEAAKSILLECHKLLKPGAYSFWVVKMYVKAGRIVDFPGQWLRLCEVCGFEHIETIIAWQTEDKGTNFDFEGEKQTKVVRRQSFFRLLHIKNHPELAIDSEIVLVLRKASLTGSD